ncbi:hypothetical protein TNCV_4873421 [Trichonephila clavipes]|nr:hypothetical protein TNCV_4873421 [Trichonephila clavipes]
MQETKTTVNLIEGFRKRFTLIQCFSNSEWTRVRKRLFSLHLGNCVEERRKIGVTIFCVWKSSRRVCIGRVLPADVESGRTEEKRENPVGKNMILCGSIWCLLPGCKLPHDVPQKDKAPRCSLAVFLLKFSPIFGPGYQHSQVDAVAFPSYPRYARLERDLVIWLARETFDKQ